MTLTPERRQEIEHFVRETMLLYGVNTNRSHSALANMVHELLSEIDRLNNIVLIRDGQIKDKETLLNDALVDIDRLNKLRAEGWTDNSEWVRVQADQAQTPNKTLVSPAMARILTNKNITVTPEMTAARMEQIEQLGMESLKKHHPTLYAEVIAEQESAAPAREKEGR